MEKKQKYKRRRVMLLVKKELQVDEIIFVEGIAEVLKGGVKEKEGEITLWFMFHPKPVHDQLMNMNK